MRLIADENIEAQVIAWLRAKGNDVLSIRESAPGSDDLEILGLAVADIRILLTQDKDFGELIFRHKLPAPGVIFLRFDAKSSAETISLLTSFWEEIRGLAEGNFLILSNDRIRVRPLAQLRGD